MYSCCSPQLLREWYFLHIFFGLFLLFLLMAHLHEMFTRVGKYDSECMCGCMCVRVKRQKVEPSMGIGSME